MRKTAVNLSVPEATEQLRKMLFEKGFTVFCDVNHQDNAKGVDLEMPASRVLIFGNPIAGTKLMLIEVRPVKASNLATYFISN